MEYGTSDKIQTAAVSEGKEHDVLVAGISPDSVYIFLFLFGEHAYDDAFAEIPVALAETGKAADDSFSCVIGSLDGSLLSVRQTDEKEALRLLEEGKVEGVFMTQRNWS